MKEKTKSQQTEIGKLYKVQFEVYSKRENAETMLKKLKEKGFDRFIKVE